MRSRRPSHDQVADVARRRLEQLGAELAEIRADAGVEPDLLGGAGEEDSDPGSPPAPGGGPAGTEPGRHARRSVGAVGIVPAWLRGRVPPALQERIAMQGSHVAVVAVLVVLAAAGTVWSVARAGGSTTTLPAVSSPPSALVSLEPSATGVAAAPSAAATAAPVGAAATAQGAAAPAPTATVHVVVDVAGRVRRPGIATLPLGSRVADALRAAGGTRRGVRLGALNLARVLVDGEQILVGVRAPPGAAAAAAAAPTTGTAAPAALVDINTASSTELEALPEVGPVTAQAIVDFRTQNGPFTSVDELLEVSGIGDATLAKVAPFVTL